MKRKVSFLLLFAMLAAMILPAGTYALENDSGLETAIKIAKSKFTIPEDYKFNYNLSTENGKRVWYLNWSSKDGSEGNISVRIDDSGTILGYDKYKQYDYTRGKKLPEISRQEAKDLAESFIERINPKILPQLKYQEEGLNYLGDYAYYINFVRIVNNIPFYNNTVNVRVDCDTGEILGYYMYWYDDVEFPAPENIISLEQAEKAYKEKLGLELVYSYKIEDEKMTAYAIYTPRYSNYSYAIDAFTGEKVTINEGYYRPYDEADMMSRQKMELYNAAGQGAEPSLTPEEIEAIREASKIIGVDQAEKIARDTDALGLSDDYKLSYYNLSKNWPDRDKFVWYLSFTKDTTGQNDYGFVGATVNANTGEIISFYINTPYKDGETPKYDKEASKTQVEKFLKEFKPQKFGETEYDDTGEDYGIQYSSNGLPRQYTFRYERKVNGVPFPANGFTIEFNAVCGKVVSFNMNWYDLEFPSVDKVVPADKIYSELFGKVGLELQYKAENRDVYPLIKGAQEDEPNRNTLLIYCLKQGMPYNFDANSGTLLDYNGKPYKEAKPVEYTDISGHFAEERIKILAEYGIALEGKEFRPDESITQKDFLMLISKVIGNYYMPSSYSGTDEEIEEIYRILMREGIIKSGEKSPESMVTREDAVKFVIRALKYERVADIKDIFIVNFKDANEINPALTGYVAIAAGLKIVSGSDGYFYPKKQLTRAEAAVIIYNYLRI